MTHIEENNFYEKKELILNIEEDIGKNNFSDFLKGYSKINKVNFTENFTENLLIENGDGTFTLNIQKELNITDLVKTINILDEKNNYNFGVSAEETFAKILLELYKKSNNKKYLKLLNGLGYNKEMKLSIKSNYIKNSISNISKSKINILNIGRDILNIGRDILLQSIDERSKKIIFETMKAPNSNELLIDKLKLKDLKENFKNLKYNDKKEKLEDILSILKQYKNFVNLESNDGGIPMNFIETKKLYCVGISYLTDIIFEYLNLEHLIGTGYNGNFKGIHSVAIVKIKKDNGKMQNLIFDPMKKVFVEEITINKKNQFRIDYVKHSPTEKDKYLFSVGPAENEIMAQNFYNLSIGKNNKERDKLLNLAIDLSSNNIVIQRKINSIKDFKYTKINKKIDKIKENNLEYKLLLETKNKITNLMLNKIKSFLEKANSEYNLEKTLKIKEFNGKNRVYYGSRYFTIPYGEIDNKGDVIINYNNNEKRVETYENFINSFITKYK